MALIRWSPMRDVLSIPDEMNRMFDGIFGLPKREAEWGTVRWAPRMNVVEDEDKFEVTAELPGLGKDEVTIEVKDHTLTLTGEKKMEEEKKDNNYHLFERCYGQFVRTIKLPDNVETDNIAAEFKDGILTIDVPKTEKAKLKTVKINVK